MYVFDIKEFNTALENFQKCVFLPIFATVTLSDHLKESTSDNLPSFTVYIERKNVDTFTAVRVSVCVCADVIFITIEGMHMDLDVHI